MVVSSVVGAGVCGWKLGAGWVVVEAAVVVVGSKRASRSRGWDLRCANVGVRNKARPGIRNV